MKESVQKELKLLLLIVLSIFCLTACGEKATHIKKAESFIKLQVDCGTYQEVDEPEIKEKFLNYMSEEAYEAYKKEQFLYMYPDLFEQLGAKEVEIKKIKCTQSTKDEKENYTCEFEVSYKIKTNNKSIDMVDHLRIKLTQEGQVVEDIILNTSDLIKKLILDIKIQ